MTNKEQELLATLASTSEILGKLQSRLINATDIALAQQLRSLVSQFSSIINREERASLYADNFK